MSIVNGRWVWPKVPKTEWGKLGWNWVHNRTIRYPERPSEADKREVFHDIQKFLSELPCEECRGHALQYWRANPPDLTSTWSLQSWAWRFHNSVNERLKKPVMEYDEYQREYADELCRAHGQQCGVRRNADPRITSVVQLSPGNATRLVQSVPRAQAQLAPILGGAEPRAMPPYTAVAPRVVRRPYW